MDFSNDDWFCQVDQVYLQSHFGSPLWIVNENQLDSNIQAISRFTGYPGRILYPVKTNPAPALLEIIAKNGCGADCSNLSEINLALLCGFPWSSIAYNSPFQDEKTCRIVLANGGILVVDDLEVIRFINGLNMDYSGQIWLRMNPVNRVSYQGNVPNSELMSHGSTSSKFGFPEENLEEVLSEIRFCISGLHLHVGTQMDNLGAFTFAMESLHRVADALIAKNHPVKHIDIGGGLGISFTNKDVFPTLDEWVAGLSEQRRKEFLYYTEPGHALVGNAVALLVSIKTHKASRGRVWAVCDAGTDQLAKITLLHWPHWVLHQSKRYLPFEGQDALAGPLCFAGDTLLENTNLEDTKVNDCLLVTRAGAYTYSLSNSFNGRSAPAWIVMKGLNYQLKTSSEQPFSRPMLQHHLWMLKEEQTPHLLEKREIEMLSSPYLQTSIQEDSFEIVSVSSINSNFYEVELEIQSNMDFVSMPTAVRAIGNACIVAVLHKHGLESKDRPVIGKKLDIEYLGHFKTGKAFVKLNLSNEIKKAGEHWTMLVAFETSDQVCKGTFVVNV
jgi:diaminopimelate decarboxylase